MMRHLEMSVTISTSVVEKPTATSAQAKELATKVPFTLAIRDVNLAGENGLELLSYFKKHFPVRR